MAKRERPAYEHSGLGGLTLHELGRERDLLMRFITETPDAGEKAEAQSVLDQLEGTREQKVIRWGNFIAERELEIGDVDAEIERLKDRKAVLLNGVERSKARLLFEMRQQGIDEVRDPLRTVAIQLNPPSVQVADAITDDVLNDWYNQLTAPAEYQEFVRFKPGTYELDKKAVLAAVEQGVALPDGLAVVRKESLRIK